MKGEKLIGKIATIINKESELYNGYGMIVYYDGEYYHIAPYCRTLEGAMKESSLIFTRDEFRIKRDKIKV